MSSVSGIFSYSDDLNPQFVSLVVFGHAVDAGQYGTIQHLHRVETVRRVGERLLDRDPDFGLLLRPGIWCADRAPVDYLAYSQYTANQGSTDIDDAFVRSMVPAVREALDRLDILAFVPQSDVWPVAMEDDGIRPVDQPYRAEVDALFKQIYREGLFDVFPSLNCPLLIELVGSPDQRLDQLSEAVAQLEARAR